MKEVRELAQRFTPDELEACISQQLNIGNNTCEMSGPTDEVIKVLAKAEYVREQMNKGVPAGEAIRELARKIRKVQQGFESA